MGPADYKNQQVIRYHAVKHHLHIDEAERLFSDLTSFLWKCSTTEHALRPTVAVDEMWHTFILHTEAYHDFCMHFLKKFIHHRPDPVRQLDVPYANCSDAGRCSSALVDGEQNMLANCYDGGKMNSYSGDGHGQFSGNAMLVDCSNVARIANYSDAEVMAECSNVG